MTKTKGLRKQEALISEAEQLTDSVIKGIQEKKGHDIMVLDLRAMGNAVADFFIICHGDSATQVAALARSVEEEVYKSTGEDPVFKEGFENAEWILLDYISVVVHIFRKEQRDFYGVERFWADAAIRKIG
jgi:ribosome-associated protein